MVDPVRRFEVVSEEPEPQTQAPPKDRATDLILLALKTFSQKTIHALESCFALVVVALVFWAAFSILTASPTYNQLVGLAIFCVFSAAAIWMVLRPRRG